MDSLGEYWRGEGGGYDPSASRGGGGGGLVEGSHLSSTIFTTVSPSLQKANHLSGSFLATFVISLALNRKDY